MLGGGIEGGVRLVAGGAGGSISLSCNDEEDDANAVLCVQSVSILMADGVCSTGEGASCEKGELVNTCEKGKLVNTCEKGKLANT